MDSRKALRCVPWTAGGIAVVALASSLACRLFNPDFQYISDQFKTVQFVRDSAQVRRLVMDAQSFKQEKKPGVKAPEQIAFVDAMLNQPSIEVPAGSYLRMLEQSGASCSKAPYQNARYVRVRVTTGGAKGEVGWGCWGVNLAGVNAMP
jgi:hypothetical protein